MKRDKLKDKILKVLENYPATRNDDIMLTLYIWREFYPTRIHRDEKKQAYVYVKDIIDLPREDHVKIQNEENLFLPTDVRVAEQRFRNIENWRERLGYKDDSFKRI